MGGRTCMEREGLNGTGCLGVTRRRAGLRRTRQFADKLSSSSTSSRLYIVTGDSMKNLSDSHNLSKS